MLAVVVSNLTVAEKLPALRALPITHTPWLFSGTSFTFPTPGAEVLVNVAPVFSGTRFIAFPAL
jgi:hypothetical protein